MPGTVAAIVLAGLLEGTRPLIPSNYATAMTSPTWGEGASLAPYLLESHDTYWRLAAAGDFCGAGLMHGLKGGFVCRSKVEKRNAVGSTGPISAHEEPICHLAAPCTGWAEVGVRACAHKKDVQEH
jgi:hypothetical protein